MKTLNLVLLFLIANLTAKSQQSFLYNDKGQLFLDTSLTITKAQLRTWVRVEFNLVGNLSRIEIPDLFREGSVKPTNTKSILIASFICDSSDIKNIEVLNDTGWYANAVVRGLQKQSKGIAAQLKSESRKTSEQIYMGKYYVAINFMLINFYEQLKNEKAVPVIQGTIPLSR
ncbi:MAG: hypothetical protein JJE25_09165 [Bacteroidia bacterium]|nr:hypothetical protein [Bacteroidia bacterium]